MNPLLQPKLVIQRPMCRTRGCQGLENIMGHTFFSWQKMPKMQTLPEESQASTDNTLDQKPWSLYREGISHLWQDHHSWEQQEGHGDHCHFSKSLLSWDMASFSSSRPWFGRLAANVRRGDHSRPSAIFMGPLPWTRM